MPKSRTSKPGSGSTSSRPVKAGTRKTKKASPSGRAGVIPEIHAKPLPAVEPVEATMTLPAAPASAPEPSAGQAAPSHLVDEHIDLDKLSDLVSRFPSLTFMGPRIEKFRNTTIGYSDLVGLYRIATGIIADEFEGNREKAKKLDEELTHVRRYQDSLRREAEAPLQRKIKELETSIAEKNSQLQAAGLEQARLEEEFINYRNRLQEEKKRHVETANEKLMLKVLPVVDNFERALAACQATDNMERVVEGVEMIFRQMEEMLASEDVRVIPARGEAFDPVLHEAFAREETFEYPEDTVIEEFRKGYFMKEKVLRPTLVKISKVPPGDSVEYDVRAGEMIAEIQKGIEGLADIGEAEPADGGASRGLSVVE
jgi:molecular chaperone GrpE